MTERTNLQKHSIETPAEIPPAPLTYNGRAALAAEDNYEKSRELPTRRRACFRFRKIPEPEPEPSHPKPPHIYSRNQPFFFSGYRVLVDCSPTGSGKTTRIARYLHKFKDAGAKRVVYVSRSPLNTPVLELQDYPVLVGRTPYGYIKDGFKYRERTAEEAREDSPVADIPPNCKNTLIREMEENNYYASVGYYCKNICPHSKDCPFREERKEMRKVPFLRTSLQNYYPMPGDVVIFDERATIQELEVVNIEDQDLKLLLADLVLSTGKVRPFLEKVWVESESLYSTDEEASIPTSYSASKDLFELDCEQPFYSDTDWQLVIVAIKRLIEALETIRKSRKLHVGPSALLAEVVKAVRLHLGLEASEVFPKLKVLNRLSIASFADWKALRKVESSEEVLRILKESEMVRLLQDCIRFLRMDNTVSLSIVRGKLCLIRRNPRWSSIINRLQTHTIKAIVLDASARKDDYEHLFPGLKILFTSLLEVA